MSQSSVLNPRVNPKYLSGFLSPYTCVQDTGQAIFNSLPLLIFNISITLNLAVFVSVGTDQLSVRQLTYEKKQSADHRKTSSLS
ncbi:MAG: hypothetical protein ACJA05_002648 [Porticoccus sp.]|jgi:hypothetical protein|tara:strand:- start:3080 stop:3331 length:252 start_codon:yes stop_codon:yes gene_type:complete